VAAKVTAIVAAASNPARVFFIAISLGIGSPRPNKFFEPDQPDYLPTDDNILANLSELGRKN
jgi:hypothetical protein